MLPFIIAKIEDLPEADREFAKGHYKEKDGKLVLDVKDDMDDRVKGLTANNNQLKTEKQHLKEQLAKFDGFDIEKAKLAEDELKALKEKGSPSRDEITAQVRSDLQKHFDANLSKVTERSGKIEQLYKSTLLNQEITAAFVKHGVRPDAIEIATPYVASRIDVVEQDGNFVTRVKKPDGSFEVSAKQSGDGFKSVEELVEEYKTQQSLAFLFDGSKADGAGESDPVPGDAKGKSGKPGEIDLSSVKTKADAQKSDIAAAYIDKNGSEAYLNLPDS